MKRGARAARILLAQGVKVNACVCAPHARLLFCSPAVQSYDAAARVSWRLREVSWRHFSTDRPATTDVSTGPAHAQAPLDDSATAPAGAPLVYEGALAETVRRVKVRRTGPAALLPNVHSYCPSRAWC